MTLIKPAEVYNEQTVEMLADRYADTDVEQVVVSENIKNGVQTICFSDVDGTYINTNGAVRGAQAESLSRVAKTSFEEAYNMLERLGLKKAVEQYMSLDDFFKGPYKTFDSEKAAKEGTINVFADALEFTRSGIPTVAISNSAQSATERKLKALKIHNEFVGVHAEFEKETAKPNIYLAEKAIKNLDDNGWYNPNQTIISIGDQEYDIQFGNNIKKIHSNTVNVLIDRGKPYRGLAQPDHVVKSFMELYKL